MTLVVGYALGPLPGFTVGALGMLASNFLLGQGPYTPWQMAAWGWSAWPAPALGRLSGRRLGRVQLALACGLAALAAKEVMNVSTRGRSAPATRPPRCWRSPGTGLPFDLTDTVASFLFGFAFGPELARLLARMRARMDVSWEPSRLPPGCGEPAPCSGGLRLASGAPGPASRCFGVLGTGGSTRARPVRLGGVAWPRSSPS